MVNKTKDGTHKFSIKGKNFEVFFAKDGYIEVYEIENPGKTGFIFSDLKSLVLFINNLTDVAEAKIEEEE